MFDLITEFSDVLLGIKNGFSLNSSISIHSTRIYSNHKSARDHTSVIDESISNELKAGRYKGPFSQSEREGILGPFISHPLGVVPKSNGKWHIIEDLSWPCDGSFPSVNSLTDFSDVPPTGVASPKLWKLSSLLPPALTAPLSIGKTPSAIFLFDLKISG
jgi:hypothetical protein